MHRISRGMSSALYLGRPAATTSLERVILGISQESVEGGFVTRILTLVFVLLLSAAWLQAQQYPQTGSSQSGSSASAQASTVQGCLQASNGNFTLTDNADTTYQIQGDTSKLTEHVGHEVQITGRTSSSASGSTSGQTGSTSSTPQQPTIELQGVKHIAKTCKSANK